MKIFLDDALQKLAIFEGKYVRLKDERDNVAKAKEALELQVLIMGNSYRAELEIILWLF
jgi:hypothetical protein